MKIKLGHVKKVENLSRKFGSSAAFNVLYVKIRGVITPLILTDDALSVAIERARNNSEDLPKLKWSLFGWLFK